MDPGVYDRGLQEGQIKRREESDSSIRSIGFLAHAVSCAVARNPVVRGPHFLGVDIGLLAGKGRPTTDRLVHARKAGADTNQGGLRFEV
jgi:hypothetical protein